MLVLRALDSEAVRRRSYGRIIRIASDNLADWIAAEHTLFDPRIFGPSRDWRCECGKLCGEANDGMVCASCGVVVGIAEQLRHDRFGHIDLVRSVQHPLLMEGATIRSLPVLPVGYRSDLDKRDLNYLYNAVLRANLLEPSGDRTTNVPSLEAAIASLMANEQLANPLCADGRVLRSVSDLAVGELGCHLRDLGVFTFALALELAIDSGSHSITTRRTA
jgi:hypothetical protein